MGKRWEEIKKWPWQEWRGGLWHGIQLENLRNSGWIYKMQKKNLEVSPAHGKLLSSSELQQQKNSCWQYIFTLQSVFLEKSEYAIMHYRSTRQEYILYMYLYNTHSYISRAEFTKKSTETNIFIINLSIKMRSGRRNFQTKKSNAQTKRSSCLKH